MRYCSGSRPDCTGGVSQALEWRVTGECEDNEACQWSGSAAWCSGCELGCLDGACNASCGSGPNVAVSARPSKTHGGVPPWGADKLNDGVRELCEGAWVYSTGPGDEAWFMLEWRTAQTLFGFWVDTNRTDAPGMCYDGCVLAGGTIQWWNGTDWVTDGTVTGQRNDWSYTFTAPITTTKLRLFGVFASADTSYQRTNPLIFEWEVYACAD